MLLYTLLLYPTKYYTSAQFAHLCRTVNCTLVANTLSSSLISPQVWNSGCGGLYVGFPKHWHRLNKFICKKYSKLVTLPCLKKDPLVHTTQNNIGRTVVRFLQWRLEYGFNVFTHTTSINRTVLCSAPIYRLLPIDFFSPSPWCQRRSIFNLVFIW